MTIFENETESKLDCFNCGNTSFELKGVERLKGNSWQVLLRCPVCLYCKSERFSNFAFAYQLVGYLRRQKIIGNEPQKGRWLPRKREFYYYPFDPEIRNYDLSEPRRYKRDQHNSLVVG